MPRHRRPQPNPGKNHTDGATCPLLPVLASDGRYLGCVTAEDAVAAIEGGSPPEHIDALIQWLPTIPGDARLPDVIEALSGHGAAGLPVIDGEPARLAGWITYENVLNRLTADLR